MADTSVQEVTPSNEELPVELLLKCAAEDMANLLGGYDLKDVSLEGEELAYKLYLEELGKAAQSAKDRKMALSIGDACAADQTSVDESVTEETQAIRDHEAACRLGEQTPRRSANHVAENFPAVANDDVTRFCHLNANSGEETFSKAIQDLLTPLTNLVISEPTATLVAKASLAECVCCMKEKPIAKTILSACDHRYCSTCIVNLFKNATFDEQLFPPRCCKEVFPVDRVRPFMSAELEQLFDEKSVEFTTPNRTYCVNPACSAFIRPENINEDVGNCRGCLRQTCIICKGEAHDGECPEDPLVKEILDTAEEEGWRQCYSCHRLIEIAHGCNQMTCICKAEFCYNCGLKWKTCECPLMHEYRLYAEAAERAEQQGGVVDNDAIERAAEHIRQHHDCQHSRARTVGSSSYAHRYHCELCNRYTNKFSLVCNQCDMSMCISCYRNRR